MANDRDCENCIHKVNGACTVWDCKFEPKRGMTREEAKALLLNISAYDIDTQRGMKKQEAIEMAIKALEQVPCDKCVYSTSEGCQYDDITETIPPFETSEDAINRAELLKAIDTWDKFGYTETGCFVREPKNDCVKYIHYDDVIECIKDMPPVNPQKPICPSAGIDCEDCPAYEDAISRKAVTDALCSDCELYKDGKRTCFLKCEEYHFLTTLPPVVTKEERALLQRWRDNRGVSMEEFAKALELLKEDNE